MSAAPAQTRAAALVLLGLVLCFLVVLALCGLVLPATAATVPPAQVAHGAAVTTVLSHSTSVPGGAKKGVRLGPIVWAVPAVAVLAAAVATPLALRRHRERTARNSTSDDD